MRRSHFARLVPAVVVTTEATAADGGCIAPSPATRSLLFGADDQGEWTPRFERARPMYRDAIAALGLEPADVSAITVYGTRNELGLVDDTIEPVEARVPVRVWLPRDVEGPVPVLVFGHGLQQARGAGWLVAQRVQDDGVAVVELLDVAGEAPVAGNVVDGTRTFGFFQYDRVTRDDDPAPRRPRHEVSASSNESGTQLRAFFASWADGVPEIIDPFGLLETPPRPAEWDE